MIQYNRADAILAPFQSREDLAIVYKEGNLIPIPNIKIGLSDYRSFYISQKTESCEIILKDINIELTNMKKRGYIKRVYTECGFYNPRVKDWKLITSE